MSKKKNPSKPAASKGASKAAPKGAQYIMPVDPRANESIFRDIAKAIGDREFASIDEAQAYIGELMKSGQLGTGAGRFEPREMTPLDRATDLLDQAYSASGAARIALFVRALATSWECSDAYVGLAEECAETPEEAVALYTVALEMAEKTLDPEIAQEVGHYWGFHETRPYMRARRGLADSLFEMGQVGLALDHYRELLRLNPGDNQGNRYCLLRGLIAIEEIDEARALLDAQDDAGAEWAYGAVLLALTAGDTASATMALPEALQANAHVPAFLLGRRKMPRTLPATYSWNSAEEAILYVHDWRGLWAATDGALEFLKSFGA